MTSYDLRQRNPASLDATQDDAQRIGKRGKPNAKTAPNRLPLITTVTAVSCLCAALIFLFYTNPTHAETPTTKIFTPEELSQFNGTLKWWQRGPGRKIYVAIMGRVFDVSSGRRHYGPGGGYSFFAGRDASKSYITGDFTNDLTDDVANFTPEEFAGLLQWREFYDEHKQYKFVGFLEGRFYSSEGNPSKLLEKAQTLAMEHRKWEKENEAREEESVVLCNVGYSKKEGGRVYCDEGGYPRRVATPESDGEVVEKCICVDSEEVNEGKRLYEGCAADSTSCLTTTVDGDE